MLAENISNLIKEFIHSGRQHARPPRKKFGCLKWNRGKFLPNSRVVDDHFSLSRPRISTEMMQRLIHLILNALFVSRKAREQRGWALISDESQEICHA